MSVYVQDTFNRESKTLWQKKGGIWKDEREKAEIQFQPRKKFPSNLLLLFFPPPTRQRARILWYPLKD